jgi:hypothetical protein
VTPDHPADLTPFQRKYLARVRRYRTDPPTTAALWASLLPRAVVLGVLFGGPAAAAWWVGELWLAWFAGGALLGALARDHAAVRQSIALWPVTASVLDWDRIDRLTGDGTDPGP